MEQAKHDLNVSLRAAVNKTNTAWQCSLQLVQIQATLHQAIALKCGHKLGLTQMGQTRFGQIVRSVFSSPCDLRVDTETLFMDASVYVMSEPQLLELTKILVTKYTRAFTGGAGAQVGEFDVGSTAIASVIALARYNEAKAATLAAKEKNKTIIKAKEASDRELAQADQDEAKAFDAYLAVAANENQARDGLLKSLKHPRDPA